MGVEPDPKTKIITIHIKKPINIEDAETEDKINSFNRNLKENYQIKENSIRDELDSIKDVISKYNLSHYIFVKMVKHRVQFDKLLLYDTKTMLNYFKLIEHPSTSTLGRLMIESIYNMIKVWDENTKQNDKDKDKYKTKVCEKEKNINFSDYEILLKSID